MRALLLSACLLLCACEAGEDRAVEAMAADAEPEAAGSRMDALDIYEPSDQPVHGATPPE